jgi:hypothetical protein
MLVAPTEHQEIMASPQTVALLEDVAVRFRRYARESEPRLSWSVLAETNGRKAVEKHLQAKLMSEASSGAHGRKVVVLLAVEQATEGGTLVAGGMTLQLPASEEATSEVFESIIRGVFEQLDDLAPATAPVRH